MSAAQTRANEVRKTIEPERQPGRERIHRQEQGPAPAVTPPVAYRRVQLNRNGLRPADLLALQRTVGNRGVQRMVANADEDLQEETVEEDAERTVQTKPAGALDRVRTQGTGRVAGQVMTLPDAATQRPNRTGLPDGLKSGIESLSGMFLEDVKVHYNSSQPAQLNALAYAQGSEIHVAPGQEQHLPHEAWHVVQQAQGRVQPTMQMLDGVPVNDDKGLEHEADVMSERAVSVVERTSSQDPGPDSGSVQRVLQRMSVHNTDWSAAKSVRVSTGGGTGGVFIFDDDVEKVVVKPGQQLAAEILIAARLGNAVLGESVEDEWTAETPVARATSDDEAQVIKHRAEALLGDAAGEDRNRDAIDKLDEPTTVVFAYGAGADFSRLIAAKHTKKRSVLGRAIRPESAVADMWRSSGPLTLLGQASAVDIFMGNGDRLVMLINPDNWMVDRGARAINLIDNVHEAAQGVFELEDEQYFREWLARQWVTDFGAGNLAAIADETVDRLIVDIGQHLRVEDQPLVNAKLAENAQQMKTWFGDGLLQGKQKLMEVLAHPDALVAGVPNAKRRDALRSVHARKWALKGVDADTAIYIAREWVI